MKEQRIMISFKFPENLINKLNEYAEKTKYKKTTILELALEEFFKNHSVE